MIAGLIRPIFAQPDPEGSRAQFLVVVDQFEPVAVADKLDTAC